MKIDRATWRLPPAQVAVLRSHAHLGRERRYAPGQVIYEQDSLSLGFHMIVSGLVQVSMITMDGMEVILELMGEDCLCGEGSAFASTRKFSRAVALQESRTIEFVLPDMTDTFRRFPQFGATLFEISSQKLSIMMGRFVHLASRKPEDRILELFSRLGAQFGAPHPQGLLLDLRLTHEQIAAMTATTRVTVTRTLQRLRREGHITEQDGSIVLRTL